jgi:methionyl-tRNA formyltransferase
LLIHGLRSGLHIPPIRDVGWKPTDEEMRHLRHAPKLTKQHRQIDWSRWTGDDANRYWRALGPLWTSTLDADGEPVRLVFHEALPGSLVEDERALVQRWREITGWDTNSPTPGMISIIKWRQAGRADGGPELEDRVVQMPFFEQSDGSAMFPMQDGLSALKVRTITVSGRPPQPAAKALKPFVGLPRPL